MKIAEKVKEFFHNEGIHSTTIQPEFCEYKEYTDNDEGGEQTEDCVLDCPRINDNNECVLNTCCGPSKQVYRFLQSHLVLYIYYCPIHLFNEKRIYSPFIINIITSLSHLV